MLVAKPKYSRAVSIGSSDADWNCSRKPSVSGRIM
jgi:hypothetical protein